MNHRVISLLVSLLCFVFVAHTQEFPRGHADELKALRKGELQRYKRIFAQPPTADIISENPLDVTYYRLDLSITTTPQYLRGNVLIKASSLSDGLTTVTLDLMSSMTVDSVRVAGTRVNFLQHASSFDVDLDRTYNTGESIALVVYYQGRPGSSGFGSFEFSTHGGTPWVWSLSEPYGAKDWWPCKDHPSDKADSADIIVTCDSAFKVGSNGRLLEALRNDGGTVTYHWQERYPISTYLISVAITNYAQFSNWFKYSAFDSMEVLNYVLPEHLASAQSNLPRTVDMLTIYSGLFGLYPFVNEKYGHSEFGWGGGMEHQTMTSLGGFSEDLVAHELAHMWFGDMITCRTWPDIWLNEGFATYCVALYYEQKYGQAWYWNYMNGEMMSAKSAVGTISVVDTGDVGRLFDGSLVYAKGGTVLHMLRHVVGDSVFRLAINSYANDSRFRYGTASTSGFQSVFESVSGKNLDYFFGEWVNGENYPQYSYAWEADSADAGFDLKLSIGQRTNTNNPGFFTMPIDFELKATGWDTIVTVLNDSALQSFTLRVSHRPSSVVLDPGGWILKDMTRPASVSPHSLFFTNVQVGTSRRDSIVATNPDFLPLNVESVVSSDSSVTVTPPATVIPPYGTAKFTVTFTPRQVRSFGATIRFNYAGTNAYDLVNLVCAGVNPSCRWTVSQNWNLISVPLDVEDSHRSVLFPAGTSAAYTYGAESGYFREDSLRSGVGYWLRFGVSQPVTISGLRCVRDTIPVVTGWNLIGSIADAIPVGSIASDPPNIRTSRFFTYKDGYCTTDTVYPGGGYWVKVSQDGVLMLSSPGTVPASMMINIVGTDELPPDPPMGADLAHRTSQLPAEFVLEQNYPNPFNPSTVIRYSLPGGGRSAASLYRVFLRIYNLLGQAVETLADGVQAPGDKSVWWDASGVVGGVYFYRLEATSMTDPAIRFAGERKIILLR